VLWRIGALISCKRNRGFLYDPNFQTKAKILDWLTEQKIPIGKWAAGIFDWFQDNAGWFFDALSDAMERLIDGILWCLQSPHPLVIIAIFASLAFYLQRSWKPVALVIVGLLFIVNQGYWEATTESLTLVLSACLVCMGIGVPIGIAVATITRGSDDRARG